MARHMFVYDDKAYEGELNLYRATHVGASHAEAVDSVGLQPVFLFRATDVDENILTDDEVAVHRFMIKHPDAKLSVVRVVH